MKHENQAIACSKWGGLLKQINTELNLSQGQGVVSLLISEYYYY